MHLAYVNTIILNIGVYYIGRWEFLLCLFFNKFWCGLYYL